MDEWWAKYKNVLNLITYMRKKSGNMIERRYTELRFLDQLCSGNAKAMEEVVGLIPVLFSGSRNRTKNEREKLRHARRFMRP